MLSPIEVKIGTLITVAGERALANSFNPSGDETWANKEEAARDDLLQTLAPYLELPEKLRLLATSVEVYPPEGLRQVLIELAESVEPVVAG